MMVSLEASPTLAIIDSPERPDLLTKGRSIDPPGYDAGKTIKGTKRHVLVDAQGLLMQADHSSRRPAGSRRRRVADGIAVRPVPFLLTLYADSGYQDAKFRDGLAAVYPRVNLELVKRGELHRFMVPPKCLNRCAFAFLRWASVRLMLRKPIRMHYEPRNESKGARPPRSTSFDQQRHRNAPSDATRT